MKTQISQKQKGFVYTSFVIVSISVLVLLMLMPLNDLDQSLFEEREEIIKDINVHAETSKNDYQNFHTHSLNQTLQQLATDVIDNNRNVENTEEISDVIVGTQNAPGMDGYTIQDWESQIEATTDDRQLDNNHTFNTKNIQTNTENHFQIQSTPDTTLSFHSTGLQLYRNNTITQTATTNIQTARDPLIEEIHSEDRTIQQCSFEDPAEPVNSADQTQGQAHGEIVVDTANSIDESEEIIVLQDLDGEDQTEIENYAGLVAIDDTGENPDNYNNNYAVDINGVSNPNDVSGEERTHLIIYEDATNEVWSTGFTQMIEGCYTESDNAPSFINRIQLDSTEQNTGITTLIDDTDDTQSNIGYMTNNGDNEVAGISDSIGEGLTYQGFRIDNDKESEWGIEEITN